MASVVTQGDVEGIVRLDGTGKEKEIQTLAITFTADTDGSVAGALLTTTAANKLAIKGWFLDRVIAANGAVTPTANSDVYVYDEYDCDLLNGNGIDMLNGTTKDTIPATDGQNKRQPIFTGLRIAISGNSVNGAKGSIILVFVKRP